jgi:hypothetical protein
MRVRTLSLPGLLLLCAITAFSRTNITVTPDPLWAPTFNAANQVLISIALRVAHDTGTVTVSKAEISGKAGLSLWIARTRDGTAGGGGKINGPLNVFQQITGTSTYFFEGKRYRDNVPAQLQVQGLSVTLGAATCTTTVTFT